MFSIRVIPTVSCADLGFAFLASMLTMQATTYVLAIESGYEQVHAVDIFCIPAKFSHTALAGIPRCVKDRCKLLCNDLYAICKLLSFIRGDWVYLFGSFLAEVNEIAIQRQRIMKIGLRYTSETYHLVCPFNR